MNRSDDVSARERRGLDRARRSLERGRRVRGRVVASGDHGVLVELRGVPGHVPPGEVVERPTSRRIWGRAAGQWEGWVEAVGEDLVHLSATRAAERGVRTGEVLTTGRSGALTRLDDDGSLAVVPWDELSWQPALEAPPIERGTKVAGTVVGLSLDGPLLSPRALTPSPWPAIALALPEGAEVVVDVEATADGRALLRTTSAPRAAAVVPLDRLPPGTGEGTELDATVVRVNVVGGAVVLGGFSPRSPRAPRRARAAPTPGPPAPRQAASGSCS
ncbi:MAG TPA: hypothetical protein VGW10_16540 [Solirubrobacteraceae bacterium]|nr:hypothetical protein [Solirubrobacteraceae bacterium]